LAALHIYDDRRHHHDTDRKLDAELHRYTIQHGVAVDDDVIHSDGHRHVLKHRLSDNHNHVDSIVHIHPDELAVVDTHAVGDAEWRAGAVSGDIDHRAARG
jgi:hypothetical protein